MIAIGKGATHAVNPSFPVENGGSIDHTDQWARTLMASMNWSYRKQTTSKLPVALALKRESRRAFKKKIANAIVQHKIIKDLINFYRPPLAFISPGIYKMVPKGDKKVPLQGCNAKAVITGTISITATGFVLLMQLIYTGKTPRELNFLTVLT